MKKLLTQKSKTLLILVLISTLLFSACQDDDMHIIPSSRITTVEVPVSGFSKLNVSDAFTAFVTFSETEESVIIESNENIHSSINVKNQDDRLQVGLYKNTKISGKAVLNVYIKTKSLEQIVALGASMVELENTLLREDLEIDLEGACTFKGNIEVEQLHANAMGASALDLSGSSDQFNIRAEGASTMTGFGFETKNLNAVAYGASNINLSVSEKLNVTASGASMVIYKGSGTIEYQKLSDTSKIIHMD